MRKYLIMFAGATFVLTGAVTKAAYLSGHPVQTKATATTLEPVGRFAEYLCAPTDGAAPTVGKIVAV